MKPTDPLRYDHDVLRAKLWSLELYLPSSHECAGTLSRLTESLASCLRSHTEREERLLAMFTSRRGEPPGESLQHLHDEHENQRTRLAILHDLLTRGEAAPEDQLATHASSLIKELREHMAQEEAAVFRALDEQALMRGAASARAELMTEPPSHDYRAAIDQRIHAICLDRNLDPTAQASTEAGCRIERFLPELIRLASDMHSNNLIDYEDAVTERICPQCGNLDATGCCPIRARAECCLYRYLPLVLDAIESVQDRQPHVGDVEMLGCA